MAAGSSSESGLYLVAPTGGVIEIQKPGDRIQPAGRPIFGPDGTGGLVFFLARNLDGRPLRNRRVPVVLCRARMVNGRPVVDAAAAPGEPVPGKRGLLLKSILQRPIVSGIAVTFVDWDDLHRWGMINKALDLGIPEP